MVRIDVCINFELLKVIVPLIFFGAVIFSHLKWDLTDLLMRLMRCVP